MTADPPPIVIPDRATAEDDLAPSSLLGASRGRRAAWAGGVGTVIEYYDYSLFGFLIVTISPLFFPASDPAAALMSGLMLFATGFLLRPIGGLIFGRIGDRYGRKQALLATLLSMGLASTAIGLLPTYETIGVWATVLLVLVRSVQGLSAGGELGGSMTFIAESSSVSKRGANGAASAIGITVGYSVAGVTVGLISFALPTEQFGSWGWRIPFLLTLPLCLYCLWLRSRSEETLSPTAARSRRGALRRLLSDDGRGLALTSLASIAVNGTCYIGLSYLSVHLIQVLTLPQTAVYWIVVVAMMTSGGASFLAGRISDRVGLMTVTRTGMIVFAVIAVPAFAAMSTGNLVAVLVAYIALMSTAMAAAAPVLASVPMLFRTEHRYTGTALGWNIGAVTAGATTPLVAFWLVEQTDSPISPAGVCLIAAVLGVVITFPIRRHLEHRASH
ncbi:MFS transporter [Rhodococcus sp. NCIMB 12038]|jgi:MHS family proline/betaine transporter-like MFS transporter|uniref:MFS transporter n=1 Tax=Rhodococcus sp. NCIMB 12038 TaxID=933800 RepID=UPI0015C585B4|nr:MFS transporter [Rhodococcus sp. NCIMB 12038]